jgi:hypothetical protein
MVKRELFCSMISIGWIFPENEYFWPNKSPNFWNFFFKRNEIPNAAKGSKIEWSKEFLFSKVSIFPT